MRAWGAMFVIVGLLLYGAMQVSANTATPSSATPLPGVVREPGDPCYYPEKLVEAGYLSKALEEYDQLAATPGLECAADGYVTTAAKATAEAEAKKSEAQEAAKDNPFAEAQRLDDLGMDEEAKKEIDKVLEWFPDVSIPYSLRHLVDIDSRWDNIEDVIRSWWRDYAVLISILTAVLLAGTLFAVRQRRITVDIGAFTKGTSGSDAVDVMPTLVQSNYYRIHKAKGSGNPKVVTDAPSNAHLDAIVNILPDPGKFLSTAWSYLQTLWVRHYVLNATLLKDDERGAGIALTLQRKNDIVDRVELWYSSLYAVPKSTASLNDYTALAEPAAIWLYGALADATVVRPQPISTDGKPTYEWQRWLSYAYFRIGVGYRGQGDRTQAIRLYEKSLTVDPTFVPSRINLLATRTEDLATWRFSADAYNDYREIRQSLIQIANADDIPVDLWMSAWFNAGAAAEYGEESLQIGVFRTGTEPEVPFGSVFYKEMQDIFNDSLSWRVASDKGPKYQLAKAKSVESPPAPPLEPSRHGPLLLIDYSLRRLAKHYKAQLLEFKAVDTKYRFRQAMAPFLATMELRRDHKGKSVLKLVEDQEEKFKRDARLVKESPLYRYSMSCYFAAAFQLDKQHKLAAGCLGYLDDAITNHPELRIWAKYDPSLESVRASEDYHELFNAIVEDDPPSSEKPKPTPRTEHVIIFEDKKLDYFHGES